jgi:hypothetical protein
MRLAFKGLPIIAVAVSVTGCGSTPAVQYHVDQSDAGGGYRFVIPRTVIKVSQAQAASNQKPSPGEQQPAPAKNDAQGKLSVTPVPVAYDESGALLPVFSVTDDTGGLHLVSTSVTNVKYADHLIIQSIGTQVTDNRKDAISAVVSVAGLAAAGFGFAEGAPTEKCPDKSPFKPLSDFLIDKLSSTTSAVLAPNNTCWGYKITDIKELDTKGQSPIDAKGTNLAVNTKVSWFPYPACKTVTLSIFPCDPSGDAGTCKEPKSADLHNISVVSVASGQAFRRIPLPQKGKIDMHSDFCVADVTSDSSPLASDWSLMSEAIKDVKGLKQKQSTPSK